MLAAGAFVVGFRVHATNDTSQPAAAASTLNAARASALESDAPAKAGVRVALADVAALPSLQGEPKSAVEARAKQAAAAERAKEQARKRAQRLKKQRAERRKRVAARRKREAAARQRAAQSVPPAAPRPAATPPVVVTPVPTPVSTPPVYTPPAPKQKSYVGKDFDSNG